MTPAERARPDDGEALNAELSAIDIDTHCALALARVAVQALADVSPEHQVRVLNALDDAIEAVSLEENDRSRAVAGLLTDFKMRLISPDDHSRVWFLDE